MIDKIILRSTIDPEFTIEIDDRVIKCCSVLKDVVKDIDFLPFPIDVKLSKKQLQDFVAIHNHYPSAETPNDIEFSINFFKDYPEDEFKDFSWKAVFSDSKRFTAAAGDYVLNLFETMDVAEIQKYLNIVDDYTPEERKAMEEHPLEFFTGISIQMNEDDDHQQENS